MRVLIFSKDRVTQLLALWRSLQRHCSDLEEHEVVVLYKVTSDRHRRQYDSLAGLMPSVRFQEEVNIEKDFLDLVSSTSHILFLTDDSLAIQRFQLYQAEEFLIRIPHALGFSLRLGRNIRYSYPHRCDQDVVEFHELGDGVLAVDWRKYKCDFGYPMELSASVYRSLDIMALAAGANLQDLKHVENSLHHNSKRMMGHRPFLLCHRSSRIFSNPLNITAPDTGNRYSGDDSWTVERMADKFDEGWEIDVGRFVDFVPTACHQEVPFSWIRRDRS